MTKRSALLVGAFLLLGVLAWPRPRAAPPAPLPLPLPSPLVPAAAAPFGLMYWHWSNQRTLALGELDDLPLDGFAEWRGSIDLSGGRPHYVQRGGRVVSREEVPRWIVLRVEPVCHSQLDGDGADLIAALLTGYTRACAQRPVAGLQLDWDVPERRLGAYARLLRALRLRLPVGTGLSCTGLTCWLSRREVTEVVNAVDWWVPQCYGTDPPTDPHHATAQVGGIDPLITARRCAALGRPFRIGLPTFELASLWAADDTLVSASLPISVEGALAAGLDPQPLPGAQERLLGFTIAEPVVVAGRRLPLGGFLLIGVPTVSGLAQQCAELRAHAGPLCRGVSLYRLDTPNDMPCLSSAQVRAAWHGAPTPADLAWSWSGTPGAWSLTLHNRGLADLVDPVRLVIGWAVPDASPPLLPPPLRLVPAHQGVPVAPIHASELLLEVPFLRAGVQLVLPPLSAPDREPPTCIRHIPEAQP